MNTTLEDNSRTKPISWGGGVHSGYTSAPYMGKLLAQAVLGEATELPVFDPARLVACAAAAAAQGLVQ